ncbi:DUF4265 domain-containing protein [Nitratireductor sp. GCM10026969]|uniref:DUF4265 domain-containing protein n=1 Tax=Nitratireductor sp. GCM10026969 TaxID=3252645 RepID=UPI00360D2DA7
MADQIETLNLLVGRASSGNPVFENLPVIALGDGKYELRASPGLVLGVAKADIIEVAEEGAFSVISRGGNVCVQILLERPVENLQKIESRLTLALTGSVDGLTDRQLVLSIPVSNGFQKIELCIQEIIANLPGADWHYGNVYDDEKDGTTPLDWWLA